MGKVLEMAEKLWTGEVSTAEFHPLLSFFGLEELTSGLGYISSFANVSAISTDEGLILIDTGTHFTQVMNHQLLRQWSSAPVHSAVYTHGHVDHVLGIAKFDEEADSAGHARPHVIGHRRILDRFARYRLTAGYNASINARQFQVGKGAWPTNYRDPDELYDTHHQLSVGGITLELHHDRGETDDHTWVWWADRKVVFTGDLFIWASPNCGNPQKAQRYPKEWAAALLKMAALGPEILVPGHGPPIIGADRVSEALTNTAEMLNLVTDGTLSRMNDGMRLDQILAEVIVPDRLLERPYLRPVYDDPSFIIRNLWRLYGGWYDGNPSRLLPARDRALAKEVASGFGGADGLAKRANQVAKAGDLDVACHLIEWAWQLAPDSTVVNQTREAIYRRRADGESSLMAKGIFMAAARDSED